MLIRDIRFWFRKNYISIAKAVVLLAFFTGVSCLLFFYLLHFCQTSPTYAIILQYTPWAVLIIGLMLSYFFNRSKVFFLLLIMIMVQVVIEKVPTAGMNDYYFNLEGIIGVLYLVIPLNLIIFFLKREE